MGKKFKKVCAAVLSGIMTLTGAVWLPVTAAASDKDPLIAEVPSKLYSIKIADTNDYITAVQNTTTDQEEIQGVIKAVHDYVPAVDNSQDPYFPKVGNQGGINACGAWSAVYYQFTHEMNRALKRPTTPENTFQPLFVYNLIVSGNNGGTYAPDLYEFLSYTGCATYESVPDVLDYKTWNAESSIWEEANRYRIDSYMYFDNMGYKNSRVTSVTDEDIEPLKAMIRSGHIVSFAGYIFSWKFGTLKAAADKSINKNVAGQSVVTACIGKDGSHGMVIVGYDDTIWTDLNGNNKVDEGEMGAFKVVNSWDTTWKNDGFVWVAYDSLNQQSVVSGVQNETGRTPSMERFLKCNIDPNTTSSGLSFVYTVNTDNRTDNYIEITATRSSDGMKYIRRTAPYFRIPDQSGGKPMNYNGKDGAGDGTMIVDLDNIVPGVTSDTFHDYAWSFRFVDDGGDTTPLTVKDAFIADSSTQAVYRMDTAMPFEVNGSERLVNVKPYYRFSRVAVSPKSNITVGTEMKLVAYAENEVRMTDPIKYHLVISKNGKAVYTKTFKAAVVDREKRTASGSVKWTPTASGSYVATVTATDGSGAAAVRSVGFKVYPKGLTVRAVAFDKGNHVGNYEQVRITPTVTGGVAPYTYSYYYIKGGKTYKIVEDSKSSYKTKSFGANTGTYQIMVKVKDAAGTVATMTKSLVVERTRITRFEYSSDAVEKGGYVYINGRVKNAASVLKDSDFVYTITKDGKETKLTTRSDRRTLWYPKENGSYAIRLTVSYNGKVIATAEDTYTVGSGDAYAGMQKINVNVITYVCNEGKEEDFTIHYWGGKTGAIGDEKCVPLSKTVTKNVGFWSSAQTFRQYVAYIPEDATGFKFHIGDRWFGDDGVTASQNTVYVFNYDYDRCLYTKE